MYNFVIFGGQTAKPPDQEGINDPRKSLKIWSKIGLAREARQALTKHLSLFQSMCNSFTVILKNKIAQKKRLRREAKYDLKGLLWTQQKSPHETFLQLRSS